MLDKSQDFTLLMSSCHVLTMAVLSSRAYFKGRMARLSDAGDASLSPSHKAVLLFLGEGVRGADFVVEVWQMCDRSVA